jgi:hypothetical protein
MPRYVTDEKEMIAKLCSQMTVIRAEIFSASQKLAWMLGSLAWLDEQLKQPQRSRKKRAHSATHLRVIQGGEVTKG